MSSVTDVLAAAAEDSGSVRGPGVVGVLILTGLALAVLLLYRSLRKQLRRIDFDPKGRTDAERMQRPGTGEGPVSPDGGRDSDAAGRPDDENGHR
jgi:hypothetical protein